MLVYRYTRRIQIHRRFGLREKKMATGITKKGRVVEDARDSC
jgi:hypothetical protein